MGRHSSDDRDRESDREYEGRHRLPEGPPVSEPMGNQDPRQRGLDIGVSGEVQAGEDR